MNITRASIPFVISSFILIGAGCGNPDPKPPIDIEPLQPAQQAAAPASTPPMTEPQPSIAPQETLAFPGILLDEQTAEKIVRITTEKGDIVFELLPKEGPKAASNFVYLATKNYYDSLIFHRVESWVLQGGDPTGTGMGGPGYRFEDDPVSLSYEKGIVAMANAGPNTNGSQFFIMKENMPLPPSYSVFGRVLSGQDIVDTATVGMKMLTVTVEDKPTE
ncbi:MAG: peptidylprolyl isomerase [Patescibacteria group bacterium]